MPQGKGERSIVAHVGDEKRFLEEAKLIYRGKKALKDSDYHSEMNAEVFQHWMEEKVFANVPSGSVIVVDRATYHQVLTDDTKPASSQLNELQLAQWIQKHKICVKLHKKIKKKPTKH